MQVGKCLGNTWLLIFITSIIFNNSTLCCYIAVFNKYIKSFLHDILRPFGLGV